MADDYTYTHTSDNTPVFVTGQREEWGDTVWNISRDQIPLINVCGRKNIDQVKYEWFTEILKDASAKISDGKAQNFTPSAVEEKRKKISNTTMILSDAATVGDTQEKSMKSGVKSEMRHQMVNKMKVLRQSVQLRGLAGVAARDPKAGTAGGAAHGIPGLVGRYGDEVLHFDGTTQVYGTDNTKNIEIGEEDFEQDTANSKLGFTKFKNRLKAMWELGSRPTVCFLSTTDKEYVSGWDTSGVTRYTTTINEVEELVSVVITDFGQVRFYACEDMTKYAQTGTYDGTSGAMVSDFALLFDPNMVSLGIYRDFFSKELAQTTDGHTEYCAVEHTWIANAPHGIAVFDFAGAAVHTTTLGLPTTAEGYSASY